MVVAAVGIVVYLTVRIIERRGLRPHPRPPGPRPMGPDDDPDFLWDLNKKYKRSKKDKPRPDDPDAPPAAG